MFQDNNIKCYDLGEHEKSVEGKRGKAKFSLCFSSVLHVIVFYTIAKKQKQYCLIPLRK